MRVVALAEELGTSVDDVASVCRILGIGAIWGDAEISDADAERIRQAGPPRTDPNPMLPRSAPAVHGGAPMHHAGPYAVGATSQPERLPTHTDSVVHGSWPYWWRAVGIGATCVVLFLAVTYLSLGFLVIPILLVGSTWATLLLVKGAINAADGWNRIALSDGQLTGQGLIVFFIVSAAVSGGFLLLTLGLLALFIANNV